MSTPVERSTTAQEISYCHVPPPTTTSYPSSVGTQARAVPSVPWSSVMPPASVFPSQSRISSELPFQPLGKAGKRRREEAVSKRRRGVSETTFTQ